MGNNISLCLRLPTWWVPWNFTRLCTSIYNQLLNPLCGEHCNLQFWHLTTFACELLFWNLKWQFEWFAIRPLWQFHVLEWPILHVELEVPIIGPRKVEMANSVTPLNQRPMVEWYMACLNLWTDTQMTCVLMRSDKIYTHHSSFNSEQKWEDLCACLRKKRVFSLTSCNFCISTSILKLGKTIFFICNC